jgi:hypothetical protein
MSKKVNKGKSTVTISLTDEEKKILFAIATNIFKKEPNDRRWKEVAMRFGFSNQKDLKSFLAKELSLPRKGDSSLDGGDDDQN